MCRTGGRRCPCSRGQLDRHNERRRRNRQIKKEVLDHLRALPPGEHDQQLIDRLEAAPPIEAKRWAIANGLARPGRLVGMHFFNPVPLMKLVEVIRGIATDAATYETAVNFAKSLGKQTTNAEDFPAFIVNRVLMPMINEAIYTLYEGVGTVDGIDTAMRLGANHPMGPLELGDFIGLDTVLSIMNVLYEGLADSKYRPCPLLTKYVEAGWLGRKSGRGFYDYRGEHPVPTR